MSHLQRIREMDCGLCGASAPSSAHHIREGQGMAQKASDYLAIPLCYDCHQGPKGLHGDRSLWRVYKQDELTVLAQTVKRLTA